MANAYTDFQDRLYNVISAMFPDNLVIWANGNGTEPEEAYVSMYLINLPQVGREEVSTYAAEISPNSDTYQLYVKVTYEALVQFSFRGTGAGDLAHSFSLKLNNPYFWELFTENNLSKMRQSTLRNAPQKRDTVWVEGFNQDVTFAYAYTSDQPIEVIEQVIVRDSDNNVFLIPENIGQ